VEFAIGFVTGGMLAELTVPKVIRREGRASVVDERRGCVKTKNGSGARVAQIEAVRTHHRRTCCGTVTMWGESIENGPIITRWIRTRWSAS
jgi:hypothetical protein